MPNSQFIFYRSTDAGAPILDGNSGSLNTVLTAVLVNGYGATPGAGWQLAFTASGATGSFISAYRLPAGSTQNYLWVNDDAPSGSPVLGREARICGYETMTSVYTGSYPFPLSSQGVGANNPHLAVRKSATSGTSPTRSWTAIADSRSMYFFINSGDSVNYPYLGFAFGEYLSFQTNDPNRTWICGRLAESSSTVTSDTMNLIDYDISNLPAKTTGHFFARGYNGFPGSTKLVAFYDIAKGHQTSYIGGGGNNALPLPNPVGGGVFMSPVWLVDANTSTRVIKGRMRGLWHCLNDMTNVNDGDTITSSGSLVPRAFYILKNATAGIYCFETSNTVEYNS